MKPKLTCPHCDNEISVSANQITVRQNWKYVILLVVLPLLFFIPTYEVVYFKPVITEDLSLVDVSTSLNGLTLELRGVVENKSENAWKAVMVEAEFLIKTVTLWMKQKPAFQPVSRSIPVRTLKLD
jgi:hypothetical protein